MKAALKLFRDEETERLAAGRENFVKNTAQEPHVLRGKTAAYLPLIQNPITQEKKVERQWPV